MVHKVLYDSSAACCRCPAVRKQSSYPGSTPPPPLDMYHVLVSRAGVGLFD